MRRGWTNEEGLAAIRRDVERDGEPPCVECGHRRRDHAGSEGGAACAACILEEDCDARAVDALCRRTYPRHART